MLFAFSFSFRRNLCWFVLTLIANIWVLYLFRRNADGLFCVIGTGCTCIYMSIILDAGLGKDRTLIENWRPISLVDVDAKIISKVIDSISKNFLPYIIHSNQTGYVEDR